MNERDSLDGKKILIVDDEPDVLETLKEMLDMCHIHSATDFETAEELLKSNSYDVAILDIMGVRGYDLLKLANKRSTPAIMLTAHAFSPEDLVRSVEGGSRAYIPKEKLADIPTYLADTLRSREKGSEGKRVWFDRLRPYFHKKFGPDWRERHKEFWNVFEKVSMILVPTDFSFFSCTAFAWASFFATKLESRILILHVLTEKEANEMTMIPGNPWETVLERLEKGMREDFSACLAGEFSTAAEMETLVAVGSPASKIVEIAKERQADIVVIATHGRTGLSHALMGSVAEKVFRLAPCPVFSVKPPGIGITQQ